jgi:Fur family transcriptional regulator, ferric uptake regulator
MKAAKVTPKTLRDLLRTAGLRATSARVAVARVMSDAGAPLSHADVCERVGDQGFDRATIYRNLVDMVEAGLLRRADLGDHVWRFELTGADGEHDQGAHAHFVCSDCGTVECLPDGAVAVRPVRGAPRSLRAGVEVQIRGRCDDCG